MWQINVGKSRPKRVIVNRADGVSFTELVKSGDDLREDAVMQQIFDFVNSLLTRDSAANSRSLNIRTYKVITPK